jgi:blue light- and temperature-responsive anti-repressor
MNTNLYRLVYCSRNRIAGNPAAVILELENILELARANNAAAGVTGALLYNSGTFAQVLEGPLAAVERIFEKIQRDPRHGEVMVLHMGPSAGRLFPAWSMAFAGRCSESRAPVIAEALEAALTDPVAGGDQIVDLLRRILAEEDWIQEPSYPEVTMIG